MREPRTLSHASCYADFASPASLGAGYSLSVAKKDVNTDTLYVNGTAVVSQGGKLAVMNGIRGDAYLGRGDSNTYFNGHIAEVLVYTRALTDADRQSIEAYLRAKYF